MRPIPLFLSTVLALTLIGKASAVPTESIPALKVYEGDWVWAYGCDASLSIRVSDTTLAYQRMAIQNVRALDANTITGVAQTQVFDNKTCTGTPKAIHERSFSLTIRGAVSVDGRLAHQVTRTVGAVGGGGSAPGALLLNGLIYPGDYFTRTFSGQDLSFADAQNWYFGFDAPTPFEINGPTQSPPTTLLASPLFQRP